MLFAAIDVGTNSIHLILVECIRSTIRRGSCIKREARERVEKLAALLRVADGLDARHLETVTGLSVRRTSDQIVLIAQAETDMSDERAAAMFKADLFERVFGVRLIIEAQLAEVQA